jgi:hypothetical protein
MSLGLILTLGAYFHKLEMELKLRRLENSKGKLLQLKKEQGPKLDEKGNVDKQLSEVAVVEGRLAKVAQEKRLLSLEVEFEQKKLSMLKLEADDLTDEQKTLQMKLMPLKSQKLFANNFIHTDSGTPKDQSLLLKQSHLQHLQSRSKQLSSESEAKQTQTDIKTRQSDIQMDSISKLKKTSHTQSITLNNLDNEYSLERADLIRWDKLTDERLLENQSTDHSLSQTSQLSMANFPSLNGELISRTTERELQRKKARAEADDGGNQGREAAAENDRQKRAGVFEGKTRIEFDRPEIEKRKPSRGNQPTEDAVQNGRRIFGPTEEVRR